MTVLEFIKEYRFDDEYDIMDYVLKSKRKKEIIEKLSKIYETPRKEIEEKDEDFMQELMIDVEFFLDLVFEIEKGLFFIYLYSDEKGDYHYWIVAEVRIQELKEAPGIIKGDIDAISSFIDETTYKMKDKYFSLRDYNVMQERIKFLREEVDYLEKILQ